MKLWQRASLSLKLFYVVSVIISCMLVVIVSLGGVHYYTYNLYVASSNEQGLSNSGFRLSVYPELTSGGSSGVKCVIPYLFYMQWTPFKERRFQFVSE